MNLSGNSERERNGTNKYFKSILINFTNSNSEYYFCIARKSKVKFDEAITSAANNLTAIIINKHGGLLEELDGKTITNNQLLNLSLIHI